MRATAVRAISLYQRYLSPYKGYRCAYRGVTGRLSCSGFASRAIARVGVVRGLFLTRRRLGKCSASHRVAASTQRRRQTGDCDLPALDCNTGDGCACDGLADCGDDLSPCGNSPSKRAKKPLPVDTAT